MKKRNENTFFKLEVGKDMIQVSKNVLEIKKEIAITLSEIILSDELSNQ